MRSVTARTQTQTEGYDRREPADSFEPPRVPPTTPSTRAPSPPPPPAKKSPANPASGRQPAGDRCVPISLELCRQLGYNYTASANPLEQRDAREVDRLSGAAK